MASTLFHGRLLIGFTLQIGSSNAGVMIDDTHLVSGSILVDFMKADLRWKLLADFNGRTVAFKKTATLVHDVAWHMQPYIVDALRKKEKSERMFFKRVLRKINNLFRSR